MALPNSRTETVSSSSDIKSSLINDIQDQIIALFGGLLDTQKLPIPAEAIEITLGTAVARNLYDIEMDASASGGSWNLRLPISFPVGTRIQAVRTNLATNPSSDDVDIVLRRADLSGTVADVGTQATLGTTGFLEQTSIAHVVEEDYVYFVRISATGIVGDVRMSYFEIEYDRP